MKAVTVPSPFHKSTRKLIYNNDFPIFNNVINISLKKRIGLKAYALFQRDVDYVVKDGKVIIVDEFTGRLMEGRRYSDGLHQALEAKESVNIENENQTLATI